MPFVKVYNIVSIKRSWKIRILYKFYQWSADAHHTNAFKFFLKVCLVFKRKIKMYKCSKQVYLISNLKKKKISALDICCMWGEVCLCLLIEKSTNHFSRKKKVNRNFSRKMLLIEIFFFVWYIVLVSVIMYNGMKCTKCAIFRSPTDHLQIYLGGLSIKKNVQWIDYTK